MEKITTEMLTELPLPVVQHVLWHFGDSNLGVEPGTFIARLLLLMAAADDLNFVRLQLMFPDYGLAFRAVQRMAGGLEQLREQAKAAVFA